MEKKLLTKLIKDPALWPYYLILAAIVIFALKLINMAADAAAKQLSTKIAETKGLISVTKAFAQIILIALIIYMANAFYWSRTIAHLIPMPTEKPITTCEATVEIIIESNTTLNSHFMDRGGYLAFCAGGNALLLTAAPDSYGRTDQPNENQYRAVFKMDASDSAVGKPVNMLRQAQYIQVEFLSAPKQYALIRGKAVCVINSEVRIEFPLPPQKVDEGRIFVRDLGNVREVLK